MNLRPFFDITQGDTLAPADVIAFKVRDTLAADWKLCQIFGANRIEVVDRLRGSDYRDFPRLQISAYSEQQIAGTTNNDTTTTRLYIRIRYDEDEWQSLYSGEAESEAQTVGAGTDREYTQRFLTWPFGVPSMASLEHHIFILLKADEGLAVKFPNATIADLCHLARFGPSAWSEDEPDPTSGRIASNHTIQIEYDSNLIHSGSDAGKFKNVAANGG